MKRLTLPRWSLWLGGSLMAAGIVAAFAGNDSDVAASGVRERPGAAPSQAAAPKSEPRARAAGAARVELERLSVAAPPADGPMVNAFEATNWYVPPPPPPPPPPAPPPQPTAPPLPFTYLGSYAAAAAPLIILAKGDRVYTVSPGEVVDGLYRVERLLGSSVELTYLPLNVKQTLSGGA